MFVLPSVPPRETAPGGVSACIISYNEEEHIGECIDSVSWCDEVVVVDAFSQDRTAEIARERGARVIQKKWGGHVAQKNLAMDAARFRWVLSVDCDERVTPRLRDAVTNALSSDPELDGFFISRKLYYLGRWLEHGGWFPEWRLRLFRKERGQWVGTDPHDSVRVEGTTGRIAPVGRGQDAAVILHYSFRSLSHQLKVLDRYTEIQAGELLRSEHRGGFSCVTLRPLWRFLWRFIFRAGFLDGIPGFHMAVNHAYAAYMKYARLWEAQKGLAKFRPKSDVVPSKDNGQEARVP